MPTADAQSLVILGSTGSIGTQALEVLRAHPGRFNVTGLAAGGSDIATLATQIVELEPPAVAVANPNAVDALEEAVKAQAGNQKKDGRVLWRRTEILAGPAAPSEIAGSKADIVLNGITGSVGLPA